MATINVPVTVTFKAQILSAWNKVKEVLTGLKNIVKYDIKDLRYKWGKHSVKNKIKTLFKNAKVEGEVGTWSLVRGMKESGQFADLFDDYLNCGFKEQREGYAVGKLFHSKHRTIQASAVRFCMGFLKAIGEQEYTDARNEMPVAMCKKIQAMIEDGTLKMGWMI